MSRLAVILATLAALTAASVAGAHEPSLYFLVTVEAPAQHPSHSVRCPVGSGATDFESVVGGYPLRQAARSYGYAFIGRGAYVRLRIHSDRFTVKNAGRADATFRVYCEPNG